MLNFEQTVMEVQDVGSGAILRPKQEELLKAARQRYTARISARPAQGATPAGSNEEAGILRQRTKVRAPDSLLMARAASICCRSLAKLDRLLEPTALGKRSRLQLAAPEQLSFNASWRSRKLARIQKKADATIAKLESRDRAIKSIPNCPSFGYGCTQDQWATGSRQR